MQYRESAFQSDPQEALTSTKSPSPQMLHVIASGLPALYRRAYKLLRNKADAEDAVQDALLAAFKHLHQFRGESQLSTWLTAIVINCVRMQVRKRPRYLHISLESGAGEDQEYPLHDILVDDRPNPEDECHESTLNARLMKSAARLSPTLQKTFYLRFVKHLSVSDTARILGIPTGTVKAQTARARAKLRKSIRGVLGTRPRRRKGSRVRVRKLTAQRPAQPILDPAPAMPDSGYRS
jgi:RNA polymerase sigma factor (sigma-70 family)